MNINCIFCLDYIIFVTGDCKVSRLNVRCLSTVTHWLSWCPTCSTGCKWNLWCRWTYNNRWHCCTSSLWWPFWTAW